MNKEEIFQFLNTHPVCFMATVEGNKPRVRGMMLFKADENGIIFHSGEGKDLVRQLKENPDVEICAFDAQDNVQLRVSGRAEFVDELLLKQQIVSERPFLQGIVDQFGYENFIVFRMIDLVANVWTMADNMAPKSFVRL